MRLKITLIFLLIILLTSLATAQVPTRDALQIEIGDVVETTLRPGETTPFQISFTDGQNIAFELDAENDVSIRIANDETTLLRGNLVLTRHFQRLEIPEDGLYLISIINEADSETALTFNTSLIPTVPLQIGERHLIHAYGATMLDLTFEAEAGDFVVIETRSPRVRFRLEQLQPAGPPFFVLDMIDNMDLFTGVRLERTATYRIVARVQAAEVDYPPPEYIALNRPNRFTGTITTGETISGDLPPSLVAFDLNIDPGQPVLITLESDGAQAYINDDTGETLVAFGHTNVAYETLEVEWVRVEDSVQTFQPFMPARVELFGGPFTLSVDAIPFITVDGSPVRFRLDRDDDAPRFAQRLPVGTYEMTLTSTDPDIGVRVYDIFAQPFGSTDILAFPSLDSTGTITATFTLDDTTWLSFRVHPEGGYTGTVTLTLNTVEDDA